MRIAWIYDFNSQLNEPVDWGSVVDLPDRHAALNFLFPSAFQPIFSHNWVHVTREAARDVAPAFNSPVARGEDRVRARRFILQCVVAMFAEDWRMANRSKSEAGVVSRSPVSAGSFGVGG